MAGKLCGPSSSKASPASTPIPLGTAKKKKRKINIEKRKPTHASNTIITRDKSRHIFNHYTHACTRDIYILVCRNLRERYTQTIHQHTHTHENSLRCEGKRLVAKVQRCFPARKEKKEKKSFTFEQTGTKEKVPARNETSENM